MANNASLSWGKDRTTITINYDVHSNLPLARTCPSYKSFHAFATTLFCMPAEIISDSDDGSVSDASIDTTETSETKETNEATSAQTREPTSKRKRRLDQQHERKKARKKDNATTIPTTEPPKEKPPFPFTPTTHDPQFKSPNVVEDVNMATDHKELLAIHHKLGHLSFARIKKLASLGRVPKKLLNCREPRCAECLYGKQTRRPWRTSKVKNKIGKMPVNPGDMVSVDQLQSAVPGLIAQSKGSLVKNRYLVATIFVDHATDFGYVHLQKSTSSADTIEAKHEFERMAASHGIKIRHYHADNGRFADNAFMKSIRDAQQQITFCGVGAHHQNGIAEKRIRDLTEGARTMLIHATHRWPRVVNAHLWPYALRLANHLRNAVPRNEGVDSPHQEFSGVSDASLDYKQEHPFGCPVYVLDSKLQGGKGGQRKWAERARVGVYLGHTPTHSSTVSYVLNVVTGHVSAQFHLVFDDHFDTVMTSKCDTTNSLWQTLAQLPNQDPDEPFEAPTVEEPAEIPRVLQDPWYRTQRDAALADAVTNPPPAPAILIPITNDVPPSPASTQPKGSRVARDDVTGNPDLGNTYSPHSTRTGITATRTPSAGPSDNPPGVPPPSPIHPDEHIHIHAPPVVTRSGRTVTPSLRAREAANFPSLQAHAAYLADLSHLPDGTYNEPVHPSAYLSTKGDPDTFHLSQARKELDWPDFQIAMDKEIADFDQRGHWEVVHRSTLLHLKAYDIVKAIWSFKRKRRPTGELLKHKARLCAHGGQQTKGVTYSETYSPVVNWFTLRCFVVLSLINNWHTRQIDFILAFPQAELESNVYMEIPFGYHVTPEGPDWLLKLKKNVYGLKDAGRTWHLHLKKGLTSRGFTPSLIDPCVFYKGKLILIVYVDDMICMCPTSKPIDDFLHDMQKGGFSLTDQGDVNEYLGLKVTKSKDGKTMDLTQPHLIDKIISSAGLNAMSKTHQTPAVVILTKSASSKPTTESLDYRSVIGQMNYLAATTRPDIAFAVHQCARFCSNPRKPHYEAVKRIARYLAQTREAGLMLRPGKPEMECFVDADFAGTWSKEFADDSSTALSRTGFVINFAGCPIIWASKMQTEIALSTTEAEYIALSTAMRDIIPLRELLNELGRNKLVDQIDTTSVACTVFEDNASCLELAIAPKMRPRTKHINIKYHHFRSHIKSDQNPQGSIKILHVGTKEQVADIFTKPLTILPFQHLRKKLMGW